MNYLILNMVLRDASASKNTSLKTFLEIKMVNSRKMRGRPAGTVLALPLLGSGVQVSVALATTFDNVSRLQRWNLSMPLLPAAV